MSQDRKLSDIILGIEADVKLLMKLYNNVDTNLKIILNSINNSKKQLVEKPRIFDEPRRIDYPPRENATIKKIVPPEIDAEGMAIIEKLSKEKAQNKNSTNKKTQITQTINYSDGRKLFLANIKIYKNGQLINQTRTSPKGKWTAPLIPGEYFIHVSKVDSESKKLVELKYNISVPEASEPVEIEPAIVRS